MCASPPKTPVALTQFPSLDLCVTLSTLTLKRKKIPASANFRQLLANFSQCNAIFEQFQPLLEKFLLILANLS